MITEFLATNIDSHEEIYGEDNSKEEHHNKEENLWDSIKDHNFVQLKKNYITRDLIPLEKIFYHYDAIVKSSLKPQYDDVEEYILKSPQQKKMVKL